MSALQKCDKNGDDTSPTSTVKEEGSSHSQDALGRPKDHHPEIVLSLDHRTSESRVDTTFVVPVSEQALPDLVLKGHLCGLQVCHPEQMCEFYYTHSKQQIIGAVRVRESLKKQGYLSTAECGLKLNPKGIPGCKITPEDVH